MIHAHGIRTRHDMVSDIFSLTALAEEDFRFYDFPRVFGYRAILLIITARRSGKMCIESKGRDEKTAWQNMIASFKPREIFSHAAPKKNAMVLQRRLAPQISIVHIFRIVDDTIYFLS